MLFSAMRISEFTSVSQYRPGRTSAARPLSKTAGFSFSLLFLCCFFHLPATAHAQEYDLSDDEFSVRMPGMPDKDKAFSSMSPAFEAYRVTANSVEYLVFLRTKSQSARKGYEYQLLSVKGHSIGYNAGLIRESKRNGVNVDIVFDRDFKLNGFPARQFRVVSDDGPGVLRFYATDRCTYTLQVMGATDKDPQVKNFFDSFRLRRSRSNNR